MIIITAIKIYNICNNIKIMAKEVTRIEQYAIIKLLYTGDYLGRGVLQQDYLLAPIVKQQLSKHPIFSQYFYTQNHIQQSDTLYNKNPNQLNIKILRQSKQIIFPHQLINSHAINNRQNGYLVYQIPSRSVWICNIPSIRLKSQLYCISLMYNAYEKVLKPLINALNQHSLQFIQINNIWVNDNHFFMFLKPKRQENITNLQALQQDYKTRRILKRAAYNREGLEKIAMKKLANIIFKILYNNDYEEQKSKLSPFIFLSHLLIMMLSQSVTFQQFQSLMNNKNERKKFVHQERNKFITMINKNSPQQAEKRNHKFYLLSKGKKTLQNDYYTPQNKRQSYERQSFLPPSFTPNKKHSNIFKRIKQKKQRYAHTQPIEIEKSNNSQIMFESKRFAYTNQIKSYHHKKIFVYNCKNRHNSLNLSDQCSKIQQQSEKKVLKRYRETLQASKSKDKSIEKSPSQQKKAMEDLKNRIKRSLHFDKKDTIENKNLMARQSIKKKRQKLSGVQLEKIVKKSLKIQYEVEGLIDNLQHNSQTLSLERQKSRLGKNNGSLSHQDTYQENKIENSFIHVKLQKQNKMQDQKGQFNADRLVENLIESNIKQKESMPAIQEQNMIKQYNNNNDSKKNAITKNQDIQQHKDQNKITKLFENANKKVESFQQQQHYKNEDDISKKQTMPKTASKPQITNQEFSVIKNLLDHEIAIDYVDIPQIKIMNREQKQKNNKAFIIVQNSSSTLQKKKTSKITKLVNIQPDININQEIEEIRLVKKHQSKKQLQLPPQHSQQQKKQLLSKMMEREQKKQPQLTIKNQAINKKSQSIKNTNDYNTIDLSQKKNTINTEMTQFQQKKEKATISNVQKNQTVSILYGPSASVENQVQEFIQFVNKIGQAVAKTSKIIKKLQGIQWYIGLYFVYKRFYFQRKNIYQKLSKGIPKLTRYQNSINEKQWQQWLKSEHRQNTIKKIAASNLNIKASIQKMNANISKNPNANQISEFITLEKRFSHQSFICVQYVVDQFDQLCDQKFNQKQLDEQICIHISQMLSSLLIIAQLDGRIKPTKSLQSFKKVMKVNEMKIFTDKIYKLYGLDEQ